MSYLDDTAADLRRRGRLLLWIEFAAPVYWTSAQYDVFTPAPTDPRQAPMARWTPRGFDAQGIGGTQGFVGAVGSVRLANVDSALTPYFQGTDLRGTPIHLYLGVLNPDAVNDMNMVDSRSLFDGIVEAAARDEQFVTLSLGPSVDPSRVLMPRRMVDFPDFA